MKEPGLVSDSLPEGVPAESTVSELEEMACRQQQQIESQRQLLAAKEQRLRFLQQHEAKHQLVATEHERLRRLRQKVETQEQKLRKLRALRGQVDQTKLNNVSLTSDLESIRALFNEKEKELSIAVAKVEELTRQLEELQRGRDSNSNQVTSSVAAVELEKLRSELLYRNKLNEQHSARLTHQRELLAQRQKEMTAIDRRIGELQERLHRKRMLNQQLAHHVNNKQKQNRDNNQKFVPEQHQPSLSQNQPFQKCHQFQQQQQQQQQLQLQLLQKQQKLHQMQQLQLQKQHQHQQMQTPTSPSGFNNLSVMCKIVSAKATGNANAVSQGMGSTTKHAVKMSGAGTNIAAVQPYHHVPSVKSNQQPPAGASLSATCDHNKRGSRKSDQLDAMSPFGQQIVVHSSYLLAGHKDAKTQPASEEHRPAAAVGFSAEARPEEGRVAEFRPYKFDSKYQTLPTGGVSQYGATGRYDYCRPAEGVVETAQTVGVPESNQKFASNDKRLTNNGCGGFYNRVDDGVNESAETNEASQSSDGGGGDDGVDPATKNSANVGTAGSGQQQPPAHIHPMSIVRSTHIQTTTNKGLATSPSDASYAARCIASGANNLSRFCEASPFVGYVDQSSENHSVAVAVTCSSTVVTYTSTYQKPVSSVSPIYQTSSTRILPVQPQIIGSFTAAYHQQQQNQEARKSYSQNDDAVDSYPSKPALPPKPAPPAKATPPPPPRQSAFHSQLVCQTESDRCDQQAAFADDGRDDGCPVVDANGNTELESRLAQLDLEERADADKCHSRAATAEPNANAVVRTSTNTNARNGLGLAFHAVVLPRKSDSPPPLPNVEPPSDDDLDQATKLRRIYVQNTDDKSNNNNNNNNNNYDNNGGRHSISQTAANDRLVSDVCQDSSCSDTSSAENNYAVPSSRRIELPPAYLFPESGTRLRDLVAVDAEPDVDIILSVKSGDQPNADASANDETSPRSLSPNSADGSAGATNAFNENREDTKKLRKGNLKNRNSANSKRRVSFDPLALLLDASLEGELELVVRTAEQVKNPSAANDEGITALHNAICAGHFEIVKFLVQFGCDVNAQDSDGWTPLHCAASCNNLPMVRFLVEHGACIFATTLSDQETAAEKCEEDEEGFDGCSEFLYSVQEKLGILNNGVVHAVFDYEAHNPDELSFNEGDRLTVLRKGDEWEREWWWSRLFDREGYIPRNLLGLYPRIRGNVNTSNLQD